MEVGSVRKAYMIEKEYTKSNMSFFIVAHV